MSSKSIQPFEVAIIGGGIAGAGIARDSVLRGISTVLFEKNTYGSGTSSKSSKLIHGGLRYLEIAWKALLHLQFAEFWKNFKFVFQELQETHTLARLAPELIQPLPLLLPIYKKSRRSRLALYFGTLLYGLMSRLSGGKNGTTLLWNARQVLAVLPQLNPEGLLGGAIVWDHTTDDLSLVKAVINASVREGLVAYEQAHVTHYHYHLEKKLYEISVSIQGRHEFFYAKKLINASGPWVDRVRESVHERRQDLIVPVAGAHITLKKFSDISVILEAEDGRLFFVINRGTYARAGTTERMHTDPDHVDATEDEIGYLVRAVRKYFPSIGLDRKGVLGTDAGVRPLARPKNSSMPNQISREHEVVYGPTGVLHVLGVKLTDHRRAAEEIVDLIVKDLRKSNSQIRLKSPSRFVPL